MTPKRIQFFIALVFFLLGGWAAFFPQHVMETVFLAGYRDGGRQLPFFAFNYYNTFHDPVSTSLGLLDAVGDIIMLALCYVGWKKSKAIEKVNFS